MSGRVATHEELTKIQVKGVLDECIRFAQRREGHLEPREIVAICESALRNLRA